LIFYEHFLWLIPGGVLAHFCWLVSHGQSWASFFTFYSPTFSPVIIFLAFFVSIHILSPTIVGVNKRGLPSNLYSSSFCRSPYQTSGSEWLSHCSKISSLLFGINTLGILTLVISDIEVSNFIGFGSIVVGVDVGNVSSTSVVGVYSVSAVVGVYYYLYIKGICILVWLYRWSNLM